MSAQGKKTRKEESSGGHDFGFHSTRCVEGIDQSTERGNSTAH